MEESIRRDAAMHTNGSAAPRAAAGSGRKMRAMVHRAYGSPEILELREIERPAINDDDVLVRVHAAALHIGNCFSVRGRRWLMRVDSGLLKAKTGGARLRPGGAGRGGRQGGDAVGGGGVRG